MRLFTYHHIPNTHTHTHTLNCSNLMAAPRDNPLQVFYDRDENDVAIIIPSPVYRPHDEDCWSLPQSAKRRLSRDERIKFFNFYHRKIDDAVEMMMSDDDDDDNNNSGIFTTNRKKKSLILSLDSFLSSKRDYKVRTFQFFRLLGEQRQAEYRNVAFIRRSEQDEPPVPFYDCRLHLLKLHKSCDYIDNSFSLAYATDTSRFNKLFWQQALLNQKFNLFGIGKC